MKMYTVVDLINIFHIVNFQLKMLILSRDIVYERDFHCLTALFPLLDSSLKLVLSEFVYDICVFLQ